MSYNLNLSLKNINNLSEEILSDKSEFKKIKKNFNTTINTPEDLIIVSDILFANNKETPLLNSLCRKIFNYKISDFFPLVDELNPQDIKRLSLMVETNYTSLTDTTCQIVNSTRFHKKIVVDFDSILKFNPILETRLKNFNHASTYCHYFIHQKNFDTFLSPIFSSENLNLSDIIHFFQFWQKQGTATNKPNSLSEYFLDNSSILNNVLQQFEKITINLEMDSKNIHYLKNSMDSFISDYPKIFNKVFHSSNKFCDRNNITFNQFIIPSITSEMVKEKNIDLIIKKLTYTICQTSNCTKNLVKINHIFTNCVLLFEEYPLLSNYLSKNSLSLYELFDSNISFMFKENLFNIGKSMSILNIDSLKDDEKFLKPSTLVMGSSLSNQIQEGYSFLKPMLTHYELQQDLPITINKNSLKYKI